VNVEVKKLAPVLAAVVLGVVFYGGVAHFFPMGFAPAVAVMGGMIIVAIVSARDATQKTGISDQAEALAALEDEVWIIDRTTDDILYRNRAAAARGAIGSTDDILALDQRYILRDLLSGSVAPQLCTLYNEGKIFRPSIVCLGPRQVMLVLHDITQEVAEQQVKSDFISTVSHELRSPLTSIKGAMGLLLSNAAGRLPDPARELLEISHRNADRLVVILNDILDLQKIVDEGLGFEKVPVDAGALVHEAIAASSMFSQRFDLKVEVVGAQRPVVLNSDPNRIMQVLGNLLTNAAKFSRPHSTVEVTIEDKARTVSFHVQDQGEGIRLEDQSKIFERFADLENSDRQRKGGSGLGLSICKAIVDRLGGSIGFESTPGVGTTFSFHLPKGGAVVVGGHNKTEKCDVG